MATPLNEGTKLGHYEIRSQLGAGGMGEVYLAQDTKLDVRIKRKKFSRNLVRVPGKKTFPNYQLAVVHIGLGETEAAKEALQRGPIRNTRRS